jgi:hypothetical protein
LSGSVSAPALSSKSVSPFENTADAETDKAIDCPSGDYEWKLKRAAIFQQRTEPRRSEARPLLAKTVGPDRQNSVAHDGSLSHVGTIANHESKIRDSACIDTSQQVHLSGSRFPDSPVLEFVHSQW